MSISSKYLLHKYNLLKLAQVLCGWLGRRGRVGVLLVLHELVLVILPVLLGVLSKFQTLSLSLAVDIQSIAY